MAIKSAEAFVYKIDEFKNFINKCGLHYKLHITKKESSIEQLHPLNGKTIVLTGTRDKIIIEFLKNINANNGSNISKNTFLVIAKNKEEDTGKLKEAKSLNIPIMSVDEFTQIYIKK